jgi:hypothetical protein
LSRVPARASALLISRGFSKSLQTNAGIVPRLGHGSFPGCALRFTVHRNLTIRRRTVGHTHSVVAQSARTIEKTL